MQAQLISTSETCGMEQFWNELQMDLPSSYEIVSVIFRLTLAALVGSIPGFQRELLGQPAGLRTHMMVSVGAAIFVMAALEAGASAGDTTRVIQGVATGIGFVGAGAIMKSKQEQVVHGLTTASSVWLTAGLGTAAGMGRIWLSIMGSLLALVILSILSWISDRVGPENGGKVRPRSGERSSRSDF
jgi:putative Mg2+ transporter-C (MgtC) family protein